LYQVKAVVLCTYEYNEADKLVTLYSLQRGKIGAIAKGVRKPRSKMRGGAQPFCYGLYQLYPGKTLHTITQYEMDNFLVPVESSPETFIFASYMAELLNLAVPPEEPCPSLFSLLVNCLAALQGMDPALVTHFYQLQMLKHLGFEPRLDGCVGCGRDYDGKPWRFSPLTGGVVCPSCQSSAFPGKEVSPGVLAVMGRLLQTDLDRLSRLKLSDLHRKTLGKILPSYISCRLETQAKSWPLVEKLLHG
jgi:DNA repair protein RecO (recombination protein O)